jgi:hypothetical protein
MAVAPGRDGDLEPADVDAVAAYVGAISRQEPAKKPFNRHLGRRAGNQRFTTSTALPNFRLDRTAVY